VIAKLILTSDTFNFNLANPDGSDFRLLSNIFGSAVLKMWIAYWNKLDKQAVIFFKIPNIGGGASVTFNAYWGNPSATNISDPDSLGFLFYESFDGATIPISKWSGSVTAGSSDYGYSIPVNNLFTSITDPLLGKTSWIMEAGVYAYFYGGTISPSYRCIGFEFLGTENNFLIELSVVDHIRHNAIVPGQASTQEIYQPYGGIEDQSYHDIYIDYHEENDSITVKLKNRKTYDDVSYQVWRKVEGDTRPLNVRVCGTQVGQYSGGYPVYINWLVLRDYDGISTSHIDGRDLYIPYENVQHQNQDYRAFSPDFTSLQYEHTSSSGGNPYLLSDEGFDSDTDVWISDDGAALLADGVSLTINTGWKEDITSRSYIHYDSGHEYYYNASKLSDKETDEMGRNIWICTTSSGWASIKFPEPTAIGAFRIKSETTSPDSSFYSNTKFNTSSMPHTYSTILNGSATYLSDGSNSSYWQTYYYDGIYEWISIDLGIAKTIYKIILSSGYESVTRCIRNFRIEGSPNNISWSTVYTGACTASTGAQEFMFPNPSSSYRYWRLYVFDNWGSNLLQINRFELYYGYHILDKGSPKNFIFYGSNFNPLLYFNKAIKLLEGTFENTIDWQSRVLTNMVTYRYYILYINDTYENSVIKIREWQMMPYLGQIKRKYPAQLRLHPALYGNWQYNFPKEISLQGSLDSINWTTLLPWTYTYTPFIQHYAEYGYWQRYSFSNLLGFWSFRLLCRGNWEASDNKIIIGEWSLHELEEEENIYRILNGTTNNIQQIWATETCGLSAEHGRVFIANDKINTVAKDRLVKSSDLLGDYYDFNVI
jgi:hypothetical protein